MNGEYADPNGCERDAIDNLAAQHLFGADGRSLASSVGATIDGGVERRCMGCQGNRLHRHGKARTGVQRWRCRACGQTFSSTSGTMLAGLHEPDKLVRVVTDMLSIEPSSCRRLGTTLGLSKMTIWAWRQKIGRAFAALETRTGDGGDRGSVLDSAEAAMTVIRESRKASREWVDHQRNPARCPKPERLRWVDYRLRGLPLPQPMTPYWVPIRISADGACHFRYRRATPGSGDRATAETETGSALACGTGRGVREYLSNSAQACRPLPKSATIGSQAAAHQSSPLDIGDLVSRLRAFIRAFSGPATKHLDCYLAWFSIRLRVPDDRGRQWMRQRILTVLMAHLPTRFWDMAILPGQPQLNGAE